MNRKEFLVAAIITLITVIAWVTFDILHQRSKTEISPKIQELLEPLDSNFDISGLDQQ